MSVKKLTLRTVAIWLLILSVGIAAFSLALNITGESMDYTEPEEGIVIDLDQENTETTEESEKDTEANLTTEGITKNEKFTL